ncbi:MAG TPA: hypothetical protein VH877_03550 [Polyangia bacterium]|nr:hypothetical protein [Polyangia bacterium]
MASIGFLWCSAAHAKGTGTGAPKAPCDVIDLMPEFWRAWDAGQGQPPPERVQTLRRRFLDAHIDLYRAALGDDHLTDKQLGNLVQLVGMAEAPMRRISKELPEVVCAEIPRLRRFGRFPTEHNIYIWPSLLTSDGTLRPIEGRLRSFLGPDVIAYVRPHAKSHRAFVDHELFHLLHSQENAEADVILKADVPPLYQTLWVEGLPTFFSRDQNPTAPLSEILASDTLEAQAAPRLAEWAAQLAARFDSTDEKDLKTYFWFRTEPGEVPVRVGYYVGMRVAQDVYETHGRDWKKMIALAGPALKEAVRRSLEKLSRK